MSAGFEFAEFPGLVLGDHPALGEFVSVEGFDFLQSLVAVIEGPAFRQAG